MIDFVRDDDIVNIDTLSMFEGKPCYELKIGILYLIALYFTHIL